VRDVHQILDQQHIVRGNMDRVEHVRLPLGAAELGRARGHGFADHRGIPRPDPDEVVLLDHRKWAQLCARGNRQIELRWNAHAMTRRVVTEAVVRALENPVGENLSLGERHAFVHAAIVERDDATLARTPHEHRPSGNLEPLGLIDGKFARTPGDVPGVFNKRIDGHRGAPRVTVAGL
jgi:hypothetical protein